MNKIERRTLVIECRTSGMKAKDWCEAQGIPYKKYIGWASIFNREERQSKQQEWAEVTITKEERITADIKLSCGKWTVAIESGFNAALLSEVLRVVDALC